MLLRDLQLRFANSLLDDGGPGIGVQTYRNTIAANYRNALRATYPVIRRLVGSPFFDALIDGYVRTYPSRNGDLNVYGDGLAEFLREYPYASSLEYLPDVARLEWSIDVASRAADPVGSAALFLASLAKVAPTDLPMLRVRLHPACQLVASHYPILRIWQVNQWESDAGERIDLGSGGDHLMVHREGLHVVVERLQPGEFAWLSALRDGLALEMALGAATTADAAFDVAACLRERSMDGTLQAVIVPA